ncbi:ATP-binding protein [candidate division WWE3 bacterium]|uniref:ATP-binding protein n=1 Tax=candidate division WWE3 bacterium TaxID=2053526 RepID=A0A7X9DKU9_UNCKA|nr:ATP-binding protein [candidate division WWE3 bacterium]
MSQTELKGFEVLEVQLSKNDESPKDLQFSSLSAENMFASIHGLLKDDPRAQEHFSFEMAASGDTGIKFFVVVPPHILKFVESQIYAQYPSAQIRAVPDYVSQKKREGMYYEVSHVSFTKPDFYPVKSFRDFEIDPLSSITSALTGVTQSEELWIQMLIKPLADTWQKAGAEYVKSVRDGSASSGNVNPISGALKLVSNEAAEVAAGIVTGFFTYKPSQVDTRRPDNKTPLPPKLTPTQDLEMKAIENKLSRMGFEVVIRIVALAENKDRADTHMRSILAALKQFTSSSLNGFKADTVSGNIRELNVFKERFFDSEKAIIMNTEEIATIYHYPMSNIDTPNISWTYSRKSEPPANLPVSDCNYIGTTTYRSNKMMFGLANGDDRLRHMYLIGKSGTGKSTLLESMISQDIANGAGVGVLDPHGETIEKVLERIPDHRIKDVIYFDPSDTERPMGLNLLEMSDPSQKNLMASGLVAAIKQHFDYSWGPRLEYLLNYAILTLLDVPGTTMLGITRLMEDPNYQKYILHQVKDPLVHKFWETEFKEMKGNQKLVTDAIAPIQNKVNRFLASTTIRNILGQRYSTLDIWGAMNDGKILLMNLSKGKIGADNANLLGALLVSRIQFFALQRANIPYEKRRPFYLYVDEFQNFATGSFEEILSESRKYKLGLYLTHQFTAQLPETLLKAVFGNVGTIATFSLGAPDAKVLEGEFAPYFNSEDIISLERFYIYIKLMIDGMTSHPFSARILVPWEDPNFLVPKSPNKEKVIQYSRETYGVDRGYVESKINKWVETQFDKGAAIAQDMRAKKAQTTNFNKEEAK